jgi:hypothetical protein
MKDEVVFERRPSVRRLECHHGARERLHSRVQERHRAGPTRNSVDVYDKLSRRTKAIVVPDPLPFLRPLLFRVVEYP